MKFKYYLRGCGLGILFSAIVLTIAFHTSDKSMDDETVMERASELGMVTPENTQDTVEEDTQLGKEVLNNAGNTETQKDVKPDKTQEGTQENTQASTQKNTKDDMDEDEKNSSKKTKKVRVTIKEGEACHEFAQNLYDLEIIDDKDAFLTFMGNHGYDNQMRVGTFQLSKGMTYEEIAQKCTYQ